MVGEAPTAMPMVTTDGSLPHERPGPCRIGVALPPAAVPAAIPVTWAAAQARAPVLVPSPNHMCWVRPYPRMVSPHEGLAGAGPRQPIIAGRRQYVNPKSLSMKYMFNGDFTIGSRPLVLTVDPPESQRSHVATGLRIWDGGIVLAKYLEYFVPEKVRACGKPQLRGLELGSGTGIGGLSFALMGQHVVLSDLGDIQGAATQANITQNLPQVAAAHGSASFEVLDWSKLPDRSCLGAFDVVFAGDVIWHETLVEPFLQAVSWATSGPGVSAEVLLSHKLRDQESVELFERLLVQAGLYIEKKVPTEQVLGEDGHPEVFVYHFRRR